MAKDKAQQEKRERGRPSKYRGQETCRQVEIACRLGAIDLDLASLFDVSEDTIYEWQKEYPEFSEAIKRGKAVPDGEVEAALLARAKGYSHQAIEIFCTKGGQIVTEEYTKHYPPSEVACIFWLSNRRPDKWRKNADNGQEQQKPQRRLVYEDWGE